MIGDLLGGSLTEDEFNTLYSISTNMEWPPLRQKDIEALEALSFIRREREKVRLTELGIFRLALGLKPSQKALDAAVKCYELADFPKPNTLTKKVIKLVTIQA